MVTHAFHFYRNVFRMSLLMFKTLLTSVYFSFQTRKMTLNYCSIINTSHTSILNTNFLTEIRVYVTENLLHTQISSPHRALDSASRLYKQVTSSSLANSVKYFRD
jgi:hypothetical protein